VPKDKIETIRAREIKAPKGLLNKEIHLIVCEGRKHQGF
jgi:uncharacterized protein YlaI